MAIVGPATFQKLTFSGDLSVARYRRLGWYRSLLLAALGAFIAIGAGTVLGFLSNTPGLIWSILFLLLLFPILWLRPIWAVYGLVIGAATFENFSLHYPDSLTDRVPFFRSFDGMGNPIPLPFSPADLLIIAGLLVLILHRMADRQRPLEGGPLFWAIGCYSLAVLFGLIYGISTGGNVQAALQEVQPLLYLFPVYLLAFNLLRTDRQVKLVFWLFLIAVALKGLIGSWRFLVTLGGNLSKIGVISPQNSLLSHEESLFFALFFIFIILMWLLRTGRDQLGLVILLSPPVLLAFLANQRRIGTLALILGVLAVGLLVYFLVQRRRNLIRSLALIGAIIFPIYVLVYGNSDGLLAEPASAIISVFQPNERDMSSNLYRVAETESLQGNILLNPLLGRGFGKPIIWYEPVPDLSNLFSMWEYIPHNTLLWVWMRIGLVGYIAFWFMIGRFIVEASLVAKFQGDFYLAGIAILSIAATIIWLAVGALDQGLIDFRSTVMLGVLMGLVSRLSVRRANQEALDSPKTTEIISS